MATETTILFKAGESITVGKLSRRLWKGAGRELQSLGYTGYPTGKGAAKRYTLDKDVPEASILRKQANSKLYTFSVEDRIGSASGIVDELRSEMEEWQSNMEAAEMDQVPKFEEVTECLDQLETAMQELEGLDIPESLLDVPVLVSRCGVKDGRSRGDRLGEALDELISVVDVLREKAEELVDEDDSEKAAEAAQEITEFAEEVNNAHSEAECIAFPGMY